jgi:hypothetical protein
VRGKQQEEESNPLKVWGLVGLGVVAVALIGYLVYRGLGIGGVAPREQTTAEVNIQKIATIYREFTDAHRGKAPANVEELKAWATKLKKDKLTQLGIDDPEQAFTSPRDKQPYVVVPTRMNMLQPDMFVAYEKVGVGGKRLGVTAMGREFEVPEENLKYHVPGMK